MPVAYTSRSILSQSAKAFVSPENPFPFSATLKPKRSSLCSASNAEVMHVLWAVGLMLYLIFVSVSAFDYYEFLVRVFVSHKCLL